MRIDPRTTIVPPGTTGIQRRAAPGQRFALDGRREAGSSAAASSAAPLATMDALLALQGEDPAERRRRKVQRGRDLLDGLDRIKAGLLHGAVSNGELKAVAASLAERAEASGDPALDEVVAHIELRAHVELAKLGRA